MKTKICKKCDQIKSVDDFYINKNTCKKCILLRAKETGKKYREKNRDKINSRNKSYYLKNKQKIAKKHKDYRINNYEKLRNRSKAYYKDYKDILISKTKSYYNDPINKIKRSEYIRQYEKDNSKKISKRKHEYYLKNKNKILKRQFAYCKKRRKEDASFSLRMNISRAIRAKLLKNNSKKYKSCLDELPFTIEELKLHIEKQFECWMNWENYGNFNFKTWNDNDQSTWTWSLDHIVPQSEFNYSSMQEDSFKKCWSLENLRPYSAKQNLLDRNNRKILMNE